MEQGSRSDGYRLGYFAAISLMLMTSVVDAVEVKLDRKRSAIETLHNDRVVEVERIQDVENTLSGSFAKTSRKCPPFCIQPKQAERRVKTVAEIDVFDFLKGQVVSGKGVLIDAREESWFKEDTIPGSINIPFTWLETQQKDLNNVLDQLGVRQRGKVNSVVRTVEKFGFLSGKLKTDSWDFSHAKEIIVWCNGPWSAQSARAIRALIKIGYPADKIKYYRGGMQLWKILGLTTIKP